MIKIKNGTIKIEGTPAKLCMELSIIAKSLREGVADSTNEKFADKFISGALEDSKLSKEEIVHKYVCGKQKADSDIKELLDTLKAMIRED